MSESKDLLGSADGVTVVEEGGAYQVAFGIDRELVRRIKEVEGAKFDKHDEVWVVPGEQKDALVKAVAGMRYESAEIGSSRVKIEELAKANAVLLMKENGTDASVPVKIGNAYTKEPSSGDIINVNGYFAAQLTGFGNKDGAAFVAVHRLADLTKPVMKGDKVKITYGEHGLGEVTDISHVKTMDEMRKDFNSTLGQNSLGVTVEEAGDMFRVSFGFNPVMQQRLQQIDKVVFNKDAKAFEVPMALKDNLVRAAADMRREYISDVQERAQLISVAEDKMDSPRLVDAFTKEGIAHRGKVVDVSDRYVMQYGGKDEFKLHRRGSLDHQDVVKDQQLKITYNKGRGTVEDISKEQVREGHAR